MRLTPEEQAFADVLPVDWPSGIATALAMINGEGRARAMFNGIAWPVGAPFDLVADIDAALLALVGDTCRPPQPVPAAA